MEKVKEFFKLFFKSKFNIVLVAMGVLFLVLVVLSNFIQVCLRISVFVLAAEFFLLGIKFFKLSKKKVVNYNKFFNENETDEFVPTPMKRSYIIGGICFLLLSLALLYSAIIRFVWVFGI